MIKLKFDKEYATSHFKEVDFLKDNGVDYVFKKNENGIKVFKYTKTPQLFRLLEIFYTQN